MLDEVLAELTGPEAAAAARVRDRAGAYLHTADPGEAAAAVQLAARRAGLEQLADRLEHHGELPWSTRWLLGPDEEPHRTIAALDAPVVAVWTHAGLVGAVDQAGGYGLWTLATGEPRRRGRLGHALWPRRAAGVVTARDRHLLVELTRDDALVLHEPKGGETVEWDRVTPAATLRAVHATGPTVVAADADGNLHRWTVEEDPPRLRPWTVEPATGPADQAGAGSVDGAPLLVSGGRVLDLTTHRGQALHPDDVRAVDAQAASVGRLAGGRAVAVTVARHGGLRVFDLADGEPLTAPRPTNRPTAVAVDPAGVVTAGFDGVIRLWDVADWAAPPVEPVTVSTPLAAVVVTRADGRRVAVVGHANENLGVWDLEAGQAPQDSLFTGHYAVGVATAGGLVVTGGLDGRVAVFDVDSGEHLHTFVTPYADPLPGTGTMTRPGQTVRKGPEPVRSVAAGLTPGGQPVGVSLGDRGWLRRWDLARGRALGGVALGRAGVAVAVGERDGVPVAVAATAQHLHVYDLTTGAYVDRLAVLDKNAQLTALAVSGGTVVGIDGDGALRRWRLDDGAPIGAPRPGHHGTARALSCGRLLAVTGGLDGTVRVWDLATGRQRLRIPVEVAVHSVALADDGTVVVGTTTGIAALRVGSPG